MRTLILFSIVVAVAAQSTNAQTAELPAATPAPLRQVARDSLILSSIERDVGPLAAAPPQVVVSPRWRVLVAFAPTIPVFASDARFGHALSGCRGELPPNTEPGAFAAAHSPWAAFDSATAAQPLVVLSIAPNGGPGAACGDTLVDQTIAVARGLEFLSPAYFADRNPASASLRLGETQLRPAYAGRARTLRVRSGIVNRDSTQQLRLYVPLEDFAPDSSGRFEPAQLRIISSGTRRDTLVIPERVLRQVWLQALPWRIARLDASQAGSSQLTIPVPDDSAVSVSAAALRAGNRTESARAAQVGMASNRADTRRYARVVVGTTLWAAGDSLAAAVVMGQAVEADPCLASSPRANSLVRSAVSRVRPADHCVVRAPVGVFARGLTFPGGGQATSGRRARNVALATAGLFAASSLTALRSRQVYSRYQSATTTSTAGNLYDQASNYRAMATGLAVTGVAVWVGSAIEAAVRQSRRNSSARALSTYGGAE